MSHRDGWTPAGAARRAVAVAVFAVSAVYAAEALTVGYEFARQLRLSRDVDRRTRLEVLDDLRHSGVDATTSPPSHLFLRDGEHGSKVSVFTSGGQEFLPVAGIANRTAVVCNENGHYVINRADRYGFNNPPAVWDMSPIAIAAVGDSFTYGLCVDTADSYIGRIRERYPATINVGNTSNGPLFELAALREYLPAVKPELVLWFFFENDIEDIQFERQDAVLMRYLREPHFTQHLRERQAEIDRLVAGLVDDREREARQRAADAARFSERARMFLTLSRISDLLRESRQNLFGEPDARVLNDEDWTLFDDILAGADATVKAWGGRIHFVYLPTLRRFGTPIGIRLDFRTMLPKDYLDRLHSRVLAIARRHAFPITDLTAAFEGHGHARRDLFSPVFHYSREGNRLVADAVLAAISADAH
jgi:hypothetical protein